MKACGVIAAIAVVCLSLFCSGIVALVAFAPKPTPEQRAASKAATEKWSKEATGKRMVQELVTLKLKSPTSAKFDLVAGYKDGEMFVIGTVDSQNSFGAMIRAHILGEFKDGKLEKLTLDDKILLDHSALAR